MARFRSDSRPATSAHGSAAPRRETPRADRSEALRAGLREELGRERYERYFTGGTTIEAVEGAVEITVPSPFLAELIQRRFAPAIGRMAARGEDQRVAVEVRIDRSRGTHGRSAPAGAGMPSPAAGPRRAPRTDRLRHTLDEFVEGASNRLALGAARRIASGNDDLGFSPLFLHGPSGVGKTHLLQGVAAGFRQRLPGARVRYVSAESFTNEYITAVRSGKIDRFRRAWRAVKLLCLDDVHFVAGKEGTQQELLYTLETLGLDEARLVLASDEHPRDIAKLAERLSSRFLSGAIIRIEPPDDDLRRRLVRELASRRGLAMTDEAVGLIVHRTGAIKGCSVRDIEGMLTQVEAVRRLAPDLCGCDAVLDAGAVSRAFGVTGGRGSGGGAARAPVRFEAIAEQTCAMLGVAFGDVTGSGRHRRVVLARRLMIRLARDLTTMSFPDIAKCLKRPSHSTVVTAHRSISGLLEAGDTFDMGEGVGAVPLAELLATARARVLEASGR